MYVSENFGIFWRVVWISSLASLTIEKILIQSLERVGVMGVKNFYLYMGNISGENWNIPLLSLYDCDIGVVEIKISKGGMHLHVFSTSADFWRMNYDE